MPITLKRVYEEPAESDGYRILVDRLWPRGLAKEDLELDAWLKQIAPSDRLRKAFHNDEITWGEFRNRYLADLDQHRDELRRLVVIAQKGRLTLVFGAKDSEHNNAVVVKQYLLLLGAG
jgi:uncharacterized protein YeaO (DUF488 family)